MPILDSSFLIDLEKRLPRALELLEALTDSGEELLVPPQTAIETLAGRGSLQRGFKDLHRAFTLLELDEATIIATVELARTTQKLGTFAGWADAQIAAAAKIHATWVLTADGRDFARMRVDHWDYRAGDGPITYDLEGP